MSTHQASAQDWAAGIRKMIESAEADGYEVVSDCDLRYGDPANLRLVIIPNDAPTQEIQVWPHVPRGD